jgi:drug/metabolite transporter (DMT)-like permease
MKIISPKLHGILDYALIVFLYISPVTFGLANYTATYTYTLGTLYLLLTTITNYSYGIFKIVPLKVHGIIDLIAGVCVTVAAFTILQYDERAKAYYAPLGIMIVIIALFTDYNPKRDTVKAPIL